MAVASSFIEGLGEVLGALSADARGQITGATNRHMGERDAAALAPAVATLASSGGAAGLSRLQALTVKGATRVTVTAVRPDELLLVAIDPAKGSAHVEKALCAWASCEEAPRPGVALPAAPAAAQPPPPSPAARPAPAPGARAGSAGDPWAALRRSLVRGLLTEAAARKRELAGYSPAPGRAGAEPLSQAELDRAVQVLLQGIGSVLAGDGVGGARTLEALAGEGQPNLSLRWLALYWSGRAAVKSGSSAAARKHLRQALLLAKALDVEAMSVTQWIVAEVLAHDGDQPRALACLAQARSGFQRLGSRWGLARAWLAEARVLAPAGREEEALEAARQAWAAEPAWDEPPVFLARRALLRSELDEAEAILRTVAGPLAERVRSLVEALREQVLSHADASEFLRESEGPPSARSLRALERIAEAAPRFVPAREALAWAQLRMGRYAEANTIFRGLLGGPLSQTDRASVMLGLGCISQHQAGSDPDRRLQAAVAGAAPGAAEAAPEPLPRVPPAARSSAVASASSVFSGQLSVFALPDVVEFVRSARRTGLLVCSSARGLAAVHFREGRITGARSPGTPDLGELLLQARKLSTVALRAAKAAQPPDQPDHALGAALVKEGLVDAAAVQEALRRQAELTLLELVQWKDGEFAFNREGDDLQGSPCAAELDAQEVLLNVFRQMDEDARGLPAAASGPR